MVNGIPRLSEFIKKLNTTFNYIDKSAVGFLFRLSVQA